MRHRFASWGAALLFAAILPKEAAAADPPATRTIVRVRSASPAIDERLDAELSTLGFAVKDVDAGDAAADLGAVARANGAVAAIRAAPDDAVELWVEGRNAGDPPSREMIRVDARRRGNVVTVLALEALRAHLLEVRPETPPAPIPAPAPSPPPKLVEAPPPPPVAPPRPSLWIHLGAGTDASPGGLSPDFEALLEVRFEPRPWLSLDAFGTVTPLATRLEAAEGAALYRRAIAGLGLDLQKHVARVSVSVGAGGAFVTTLVQGTAPAAGFAARDQATVTLGPLVRAGASVELVHPLRAPVEIAAGV